MKRDGLGAPLSFNMTLWSCYCIGESVCYWLEKGISMDTWRRRTHNTWRWRTTLIKSERCYWMTASLYRKYNTFSDRESEQQHRTMTFAELPNHPLLLTLVCLIRYLYIFVNCVSPFCLTFQYHFNNCSNNAIVLNSYSTDECWKRTAMKKISSESNICIYYNYA